MERKNLWVCPHCLEAIQSREGKQKTIRHDIELECDEEDFEEASKCDWCEDNGFVSLYELV